MLGIKNNRFQNAWEICLATMKAKQKQKAAKTKKLNKGKTFASFLFSILPTLDDRILPLGSHVTCKNTISHLTDENIKYKIQKYKNIEI